VITVAMELGGNIVLTGFSERDFTELIVVKKMVGQYTRKMSDTIPDFEGISITLKDVHQGQDKVDIVTKVMLKGEEFAAESVGYNIFVVLDESLKRVQQQVRTRHEKSQER
jgi:hypothetical protein